MPFIGSAPNKTFVRTDGTRTGTETWQEAEANAIDIVSLDHDTHDQDVGDSITTSWQVNGDNQPTADLPMNTKKFTGVADASARNQFASAGQVQDGDFSFGGTTTGTANSYAVTLSPAITAYVDGMEVSFRAHIASSGVGATMFNVNGVGAARIRHSDGTQLLASELALSTIYTVRYNETATAWNMTGKGGDAVITITAGTALTGGGSLTQDRTLNVAVANTTNVRAGTANKVLTGSNIVDAAATVVLTDSATVAVDWASGFNFTLVIGGNRTLGLPTNPQEGTQRKIVVVQGDSSGRTLAYAANYRFPGGVVPVLSTGTGSTDVLWVDCISSTIFHVYAALDFQ